MLRVFYDELAEIELANGEKRRYKVLEINGGNALVQLFENSTGINLESSKVRFSWQDNGTWRIRGYVKPCIRWSCRPIDAGP